MEEFLEVFGQWTVSRAVSYIVAIIFLGGVYRKIAGYFKKKSLDDYEKDKRVQEVIDQAQHYPEWRQQSIAMQKQLTSAIDDMKRALAEVIRRMDAVETDNRETKKNELRDRLLTQYHYFTSKEKNPMQAWSEMEEEAFFKTYEDYIRYGGNGHMKEEVKPAMRALEVIPMREAERVTELMHSRR